MGQTEGREGREKQVRRPYRLHFKATLSPACDQQVAGSTPVLPLSGISSSKLFTHVPLSPSSIHLVPVQAGGG